MSKSNSSVDEVLKIFEQEERLESGEELQPF